MTALCGQVHPGHFRIKLGDVSWYCQSSSGCATFKNQPGYLQAATNKTGRNKKHRSTFPDWISQQRLLNLRVAAWSFLNLLATPDLHPLLMFFIATVEAETWAICFRFQLWLNYWKTATAGLLLLMSLLPQAPPQSAARAGRAGWFQPHPPWARCPPWSLQSSVYPDIQDGQKNKIKGTNNHLFCDITCRSASTYQVFPPQMLSPQNQSFHY